MQQKKSLSELDGQIEKIETYLPFHGQCEREETFSRIDIKEQVAQLNSEFLSLVEDDLDYQEALEALRSLSSQKATNLVGTIDYISDEFDATKRWDLVGVPLEDYSYYSFSWKQLQKVLDDIHAQIKKVEVIRDSDASSQKTKLQLAVRDNLQTAKRLVKRLTYEDYYRIWALSEYTVKHDNIIFLENMIKVLSWHKGKTSTEPFFESFREASAPFQEHWNASPLFGFLKKWIAEAETPEEKVAHLERFEEKIKETLVQRKGWQSWSTVPRNSMKFDVSLFAGDFAGAEETLERWFLNAWNGFQDLSFELHWLDAHETSAVGAALLLPTKLIYLGDPAQLSYVDPQRAEMHLQGNFRIASFVHEMGHVLGLPDEYYTVWDADKCEYQVWSQKGNLMSNTFGGRVLPHHIERLKEIYNEPVYN